MVDKVIDKLVDKVIDKLVDKVIDKLVDKVVDKSFSALKKQGRLERIGSNKDGYWRVMDL